MCEGRVRVGRKNRDDDVADAPGSESRATRTLPRVHLASASARRRELLLAAGVEHEAEASGVDDGELSPGRVSPEQWVTALAYLKAAAAVKARSAAGPGGVVGGTGGGTVYLGADTVVVLDGRIFGQPRDASHAREMMRALRDAEHDVVTGVALVDEDGVRRDLFMDRARVTVGHVSDEEIDAYVAGGGWRGKAGGYNLAERVTAGWPITCEGDPGTVMGLPMRVLPARLEAFGGR